MAKAQNRKKRRTAFQRREGNAMHGNARIQEARHVIANALRCSREARDEWAEGILTAVTDALGHAFIQARK